jgi:transcriptional regulator with XRE-family HTH domain
MQNPLVTLRVLSGKSTTAIAKQSDISKQYISNAERGFYPPNTINTLYLQTLINWSAVEGLNIREVKQLCREWQTWKREQTVELKQLNLVAELLTPVAQTVGANGQPNIKREFTSSEGTVFWYKVFTAWRYLHWDSVYGFCADLCVKPYEVDRYEAGLCTRMPSTIESALDEVHLLKGFRTDER